MRVRAPRGRTSEQERAQGVRSAPLGAGTEEEWCKRERERKRARGAKGQGLGEGAARALRRQPEGTPEPAHARRPHPAHASPPTRGRGTAAAESQPSLYTLSLRPASASSTRVDRAGEGGGSAAAREGREEEKRGGRRESAAQPRGVRASCAPSILPSPDACAQATHAPRPTKSKARGAGGAASPPSRPAAAPPQAAARRGRAGEGGGRRAVAAAARGRGRAQVRGVRPCPPCQHGLTPHAFEPASAPAVKSPPAASPPLSSQVPGGLGQGRQRLNGASTPGAPI